jgi:glycosyltransferase involved in cell wall biosynthesis
MGSNDNRSPSVQPCQPELRIAMDGRNLIRPLSGIGRSIESAVLALSDIVSELHLLAPGPLHGDFQSLTYLDRVTIHCDRIPTAIGRSLWGSSALPRRVSSIEPDIFWAPAHRLSRAISKSFPTVLTVHDLAWKFAPDTMLPHRRIGDRLLTKSSVANATSIIVPSVRVANELKAEFPEAAFKVVNVPNIVKPRTAFESHKTMSKLGVEPPFCLFVGTIEPRKNLIRTVKAFLSLPKSVRGEVKMVIAGALGWMTRDIQRVLVSGGDDIIFLNRVSEDALSSLYGLYSNDHYTRFRQKLDCDRFSRSCGLPKPCRDALFQLLVALLNHPMCVRSSNRIHCPYPNAASRQRVSPYLQSTKDDHQKTL